MLISLLRAPLAALAVLALTAAAGAETLKDIRSVTVSADATVPPSVAKLASQQLKQAVRSTRRPVRLPRVTMDVRILKAVRGVGAEVGRNSAEVTVLLKDSNGSTVASEGFRINSFQPGAKAGDRALATAIAKRLAIAYQLAPVKPAAAGKRKSGQRTAKAHSTAIAAHGPNRPEDRVEEPVIIPSEAALTVRPRVRKPKVATGAETRSRGAVTPCVATQYISCN